MMRINIQSSHPEQCIHGLELNPDTTVDTLRSVVAHRYHVDNDPAVVRLLYGGRLMHNGATVGSYGVRDGSSIHVVARPGAASPPSASSSAAPQSASQAAGGGGGLGGMNFDLGNIDFAQLGRAMPGLVSSFAAQNNPNRAAPAPAPADGAANLSTASNLLGALLGAGAQQRASLAQATPSSPQGSARTSGGGGGGSTSRAANFGNMASEFLSNPAVAGALAGLLGNMARSTGSASGGTNNPSTPAAAPASAASAGVASSAPSVGVHQGGFGLNFTGANAPPTHASPEPPVKPPSSPPAPPSPPFSITAPTPVAGTVPLSGPYFVEHLMDAVQQSGTDMGVVGMGFLMGNALSLQPLRQPFATAWREYSTRQAAVVFPEDDAFAERRIISLAGSEGERAYAAMLRQPDIQTFLRAQGGVNSAAALNTLHGEVRKFVKSLCLRLMRLAKTPSGEMTDTQWAYALRTLIVYHAGLFQERTPDWFPSGGSDAAVGFLVTVITRELQERKPNNWQTMLAMAPAMVPQLARSWHQEYRTQLRDGDTDFECFWNYPTSKDIACRDADEDTHARAVSQTLSGSMDHDDDSFANALAEELMAEHQSTAAPMTKDAAIEAAMAEWIKVADMRPSMAEELEAALMLAGTPSASAPAPEFEGEASENPSAVSSLWTEMSYSRRRC